MVENGIWELLVSLKSWATNNFHHGFKLDSKLLGHSVALGFGVLHLFVRSLMSLIILMAYSVCYNDCLMVAYSVSSKEELYGECQVFPNLHLPIKIHASSIYGKTHPYKPSQFIQTD